MIGCIGVKARNKIIRALLLRIGSIQSKANIQLDCAITELTCFGRDTEASGWLLVRGREEWHS